MPQPIIFYTGNTVARPGDALCVRGEALSALTDATLSNGEQTLPVALEQLCAQSFNFAGNLMTARHAKYNFPERCQVLGETMMDQTDMLRITGENISITGCDFSWSGRPFSHLHAMDFLLIQDTAFWGKSAVDDWMPLGTLHNAIIEDCEIREWTTGFGGDNIYFARTRIQDVLDNNRESFTTDIATGIDYAGPVSGGGQQFVFPETVDMQNALPGSKLCILSGRGAGQYRTVTAVSGHMVTIDTPFAAEPDEASVLTVNAMFSNWYFVHLTVENGGALQFYTAQNNTVVDGAEIIRSGGIGGWGQFVYGGVANNWYNSYVYNHFSDCNYYHMGGCRAPAVMEDPVLDGNRSIGCECGIYVEGAPLRLLLSGNTAEDTKTEILYRP